MNPLSVLHLATSAAATSPAVGLPAFPHLPSTVRLRTPGISPPTPWRPQSWRRWLSWWWFQ